MDDVLINVDVEKRNKIINSAMKEFSINTFQKASTNIIVEDAGISKGLLFHYFGSKKKLYKYLESFTIKIIKEGIINELDWEISDIFLRLKDISIIKFKIFQQYPYLADFSLRIFQDKTIEDIFNINPEFPIELYSQIYTHNIDYSLFKDNIDIKKALNVIRWTLEQYGEEFKKSRQFHLDTNDYKEVEKEMHGYIEMLKLCFYK